MLPVSTPPVPTALGSFHIHTNRSDGSGSPDDVAAAAARAGLNFIVLTDHGDGTRKPDAPQYRHGVLVIDGVELSTERGHYIAIGLPQAPYPLRGEPRDVVEDVKRLGGFGIVAHAHSARPGLQWHEWDAPFDGMEWLNADTEWRDERSQQLARALARYPFRPAETLAALLDRPDATLARWDVLTQRRPVVALAGADAHARAGWMDDDVDGYRRGWFLRIPSYDASFRTFAMRVALERPLTKDAAADAAHVISVLRRGAVYSAIDAVGSPAVLEFSATAAGQHLGPGDVFSDTAVPLTFSARVNARTGGVIALLKDGRILTQNPLPLLTHQSAGEGTYRVEVYLGHGPGEPPVPWIVSNPIYVRPARWGTTPTAPAVVPTITRGSQGGPWHVEKDDASAAEVAQKDRPDGPVQFTFRLADGDRAGKYAALGIGVGKGLTERTHIALRAYASRPMRISVQARQPHLGHRWQRSIYLDTEPRDIVVRFAEMTPIGSSGTFDPAVADTLLFVVDTTNTLPGTAGSFTLENLRVER
ncbi:MAG TPA: CehA/McbA family metallohydrolase [Vicinamibacterales bacterium]|nr:CehA/McbA family metallohydrolase [Vicinamibacterales bacterium]